jgi:hypothetical protein
MTNTANIIDDAEEALDLSIKAVVGTIKDRVKTAALAGHTFIYYFITNVDIEGRVVLALQEEDFEVELQNDIQNKYKISWD